MSIPNKNNSVLLADLDDKSAKDLITELAKDSSKVFFTSHAEERMLERDFTRPHVMKCLKGGQVVEGPYKEAKGNWKVNVKLSNACGDIEVVLVLDYDLVRENYILVITVF